MEMKILFISRDNLGNLWKGEMERVIKYICNLKKNKSDGWL